MWFLIDVASGEKVSEFFSSQAKLAVFMQMSPQTFSRAIQKGKNVFQFRGQEVKVVQQTIPYFAVFDFPPSENPIETFELVSEVAKWLKVPNQTVYAAIKWGNETKIKTKEGTVFWLTKLEKENAAELGAKNAAVVFPPISFPQPSVPPLQEKLPSVPLLPPKPIPPVPLPRKKVSPPSLPPETDSFTPPIPPVPLPRKKVSPPSLPPETDSFTPPIPPVPLPRKKVLLLLFRRKQIHSLHPFLLKLLKSLQPEKHFPLKLQKRLQYTLLVLQQPLQDLLSLELRERCFFRGLKRTKCLFGRKKGFFSLIW